MQFKLQTISMNVKAISTNIGKALLINALFMLIAIGVSILNDFDSAFTPLVISFLVTLITGFFPFIFVKEKPSTSLQSGFLTIVLSWLLSFIFGMLPYVLWGGEFTLMIFLYARDLTFYHMFSTAFISIETISGISSSIGMVLAIPLTAFISASLISKGKN